MSLRSGRAPRSLPTRRHQRRNHPKQCLFETLESRVLLTTLYWNAGSGDWDDTSFNWNTAANGTGTQVAWSNGDDAVFNTSQTATITITNMDYVDANSFIVSGSGYTITGGELDIEGQGNISAGLALVNTTLVNRGTLDWTGGTFSNNINFYNFSGATLNLDGGSSSASFGYNPVNDGAINWTSGNVTFQDSLQSNGELVLDGGNNTFNLANGALNTSGAGTEWLSGDVYVTSFYVNGTHLDTGSALLDGGSNTFTVEDTLVNNNAGLIWNSGDVNFTNTDIYSTGEFTLDGGTNTFTIDGGDVELYGGNFTWNSGNVLFCHGSLTNHSEFTLNAGTDKLTFDDATFIASSASNFSWTSGDLTFQNGSQLTNDSEFYWLTIPTGATLDVSGGFTLDNILLYNTGTLAWDTDNLTLNNAGIDNQGTAPATITVDESSTLDISGTFSLSGMSLENNGTLNWDSDSSDQLQSMTNNGTFNWFPVDITDAQIAGAGTVVYAANTPTGFLGIVTDTGSEVAREAGGYVIFNNDDDNYQLASGNMVLDNLKSTTVAGENDLIQLNVHTAPSGKAGYYLLSVSTNFVKLWKTADKTGGEITSATHLPAGTTTQIFVEGANFNPANPTVCKALISATFVPDDGSNPLVDKTKYQYSVYAISGPHNVTGDSKFTYKASVPGGAHGTWEAGDYSYIVGGQTYDQAKFLWGPGPALGKFYYSPAAGFTGQFDANVVGVTVTSCDENPPPSGPAVIDTASTPTYPTYLASRAPGLVTWGNTVYLDGPIVSGVARGIDFIDLGYVQTASIDHLSVTFDDTTTLTSSMQGNQYIDMATQQGAPIGQWPWQKGTTDDPTYKPYITKSASSIVSLSFHDRPMLLTRKLNNSSSQWHNTDARVSFLTMLTMASRDPGIDTTLDNPYYYIASFNWSIDYSARADGTAHIPVYLADNAVERGLWNIIDDAPEQLNVPSLPCANQAWGSSNWN